MSAVELSESGCESVSTILRKVIKDEFSIDVSKFAECNFVDMGISSIQKIILFTKLDEYGFSIAPDEFMECRSIEDVKELRTQSKINRQSYARQDVENEITESNNMQFWPAQLWFLRENFKELNKFSVILSFDCIQPIQPSVLEMAFLEIVNKYPELRVRYEISDNTYRKIPLLEPYEKVVETIQLSHKGDIDDQLKHYQQEALDSIDIESGKLFKTYLCKSVSYKQDVLLIVVHHLACDGYSLELLRKDLWESYSRLLLCNHGDHPNLAEKDLSRVLHSAKDYLNTSQVKKSIERWREEILPNLSLYSGAEKLTAENNQRKNTAFEIIEIPGVGLEALVKKMAKEYALTVNDILLIATSYSLCKRNNGNPVLIHNVHAARPAYLSLFGIDLSSAFGWVALTTPLYLKKFNEINWFSDFEKAKKIIEESFRLGLAYEFGHFFDNERCKLSKIPIAHKIVLNFHGEISKPIMEESQFVRKRANYGLGYGLENDRTTLFMINSWFDSGKLFIKWEYNQCIYSNNFVKEILNEVEAYIERLVEIHNEK